jgi:hypothetical protein
MNKYLVKECSIDPACMGENFDRFDKIHAQLGYSKGHPIELFDKSKWIEAFRLNIKDVNYKHTQRKKIEEWLVEIRNKNKYCVSPRIRNYTPDMDWEYNCVESDSEKRFPVVLTNNTTDLKIKNTCCTDDLNDKTKHWRVEPDAKLKLDLIKLYSLLGISLTSPKKIIWIDPYTDISDKKHRHMVLLEHIIKNLKNDANTSLNMVLTPTCVPIYKKKITKNCKPGEVPKYSGDNEKQKIINNSNIESTNNTINTFSAKYYKFIEERIIKINCSGICNVNLRCVEHKTNSSKYDRYHDRYIITDKVGFSFPGGLDTSEYQDGIVTRLGEDTRKELFLEYDNLFNQKPALDNNNEPKFKHRPIFDIHSFMIPRK